MESKDINPINRIGEEINYQDFKKLVEESAELMLREIFKGEDEENGKESNVE